MVGARRALSYVVSCWTTADLIGERPLACRAPLWEDRELLPRLEHTVNRVYHGSAAYRRREERMADQATIDNLAEKFQQWAETLSGEEQATLAEWMDRLRGDVSAHRAGTWWDETGAWAEYWSQSWSWS